MIFSLKALLKNYDPKEKELFLKTKFILTTTILIILTNFVAILYSLYLNGFSNIIIIPQTAGGVVMLFALGMLIKGKYNIAIHTIFISGFTTLWIVLFLESSSPTFLLLRKLDTIVLVIGLLAAMPIAFLKSRKPIIVYFLINITLFFIFNYHLKKTENLTAEAHLDYFLDNSVTMAFVFLITINIVKINQRALTFLKKELEERKKAEQSLLESQNQLADHLKNTPVGAIFWDLNFRITEWNPSAEGIFGYTRDEVIGKHPAELIIPKEAIGPANNIFNDLLYGPGKGKNINENITKNNKKIVCEWYNTVLRDLGGEKIGVASLVNDITEKKKTQAMMIQSEKMMSLGGLAAGMAHEINNPLAGIIQNAQLAHSRLTKDLPANNNVAEELGSSMVMIKGFAEKRDILNQLESINQAGQHAVKVIDNMLSFSRKNDLVRREINLEELLNDTIELAGNEYGLKKLCKLKKIEIIREFSPNLPAIFCEKSKIQQVLINLLKNASDSMDSEKQGIQTPKISLRLKKSQKNIHIEVEDNGSGMDPETCKQIFEPFFTTKADKGTGLGLSVSYFIIVDDHGGQMEVDSIVGKGTKFVIKLPFRSEQT